MKTPLTGCECGDNGASCKRKFILNLNQVTFVLCDAILGAQLRGQKEITFSSSSFGPAIAMNRDLLYTSIIIPELSKAMQELPKILKWNPQNHMLFHEDQRNEIRETLYCWFHSQGGLSILPVEMLHEIFAYVCAPPFAIIKRCLECGNTGPSLKRCGGCKLAFFCDSNCQRSCKGKHEKLCKKASEICDCDLLPSFLSANDKKGVIYTKMLFGERKDE